MANRTVKDAHTVHGTNPQYLIETIIRSRIYDSQYWKENCFALTAELLVDKAVELRYLGGVYSANIKPTPFICLLLKMLQIQPDKDIVIEFIKQEDYKYARALGAFYLRITGDSVEIYKYLEALYNDFRQMKIQNKDGNFTLIHMDEFIDELLTTDRVCDVIMPRIQKRHVLEDTDKLEQRQSLLDEDLEDIDLMAHSLENENPEAKKSRKDKSSKRRHRSKSRSRSRERRRRSRSKERRDRSRSKDRRERSKERERRDRSRSHSRHKDKSRKRKKERRHRSDSRDRHRPTFRVKDDKK